MKSWLQRKYIASPLLRNARCWGIFLFLWTMSMSFDLSMTKTNSGERSSLVEIGHVFDEHTVFPPGDRPFTMTVIDNGMLHGEGDWYQTEEIQGSTHSGTHIDAPCHFASGRWCISDIPLERLVLPAVVVDISSKINGNPDVHLTTADLQEWEAANGPIPDGSLLLIRTGWSDFYSDLLKYQGITSTTDHSAMSFPAISLEAAEWLTSFRNIYGIGLDSFSLDKSSEESVHRQVMLNNIYGLENLNNLELVPPTGTLAHVFPMNLKGASGAPVRVIIAL